MKIAFERTGGFAGLRVSKTIDSQALPQQEQEGLKKMVDDAGFFDLPPAQPTATGGADRFQYKISIDADGRQKTLNVGEAAMPDRLRPLVEYLSSAPATR